MKKKSIVVTLVMALALSLALCGCSGGQNNNGPDYADDEAMGIIAKGLEARWDITDAPSTDNTRAMRKKAIAAELEIDKPLRDRQFENSKMQEDVLSYINLVEESSKVIDSYPESDTDYYTKWTEVYNKRTAMIKVFVDEYGLTVSPKYTDTLNELLINGTAAQEKSNVDAALNQLIENTVFEKEDDGYGYYTYSAVIENTTGYDFGNVSLILALYDADNVKAEEAYASTQSWPKGEKVRFKGSSPIDAASVKPTVHYYEIAKK